MPRMKGTPTIVEEYEVAEQVAQFAKEGTQMRKAADALVNELKDKVVAYIIECTLCREPFEFKTTVASAANIYGKPSGICAKHDGTEAVLLVV